MFWAVWGIKDFSYYYNEIFSEKTFSVINNNSKYRHYTLEERCRFSDQRDLISNIFRDSREFKKKKLNGQQVTRYIEFGQNEYDTKIWNIKPILVDIQPIFWSYNFKLNFNIMIRHAFWTFLRFYFFKFFFPISSFLVTACNKNLIKIFACLFYYTTYSNIPFLHIDI